MPDPYIDSTSIHDLDQSPIFMIKMLCLLCLLCLLLSSFLVFLRSCLKYPSARKPPIQNGNRVEKLCAIDMYSSKRAHGPSFGLNCNSIAIKNQPRVKRGRACSFTVLVVIYLPSVLVVCVGVFSFWSKWLADQIAVRVWCVG